MVEKRPLRVVYVNHAARCSGAELSLLSLLRALRERGVEVHALVPEGDLAERLRALDLPVSLLPERRLRRTANPFSLASQYRWLREVRHRALAMCQEPQADLVHANRLAVAVALAQRGPALPPLIWHCRDLLAPPVAVRWLAPRCAGIIAISHVVEHMLGQAAPSRARTAVIHNGLQPEDLRLSRDPQAVRQELGIETAAPLVVTVGQLTSWKRVELALEAAELLRPRHPELRWGIVGEALFPEDAAYAEKLRSSAPPNVVFTGYRPDAADLVRAADLLAHPATAEAFGRVVLEAMALGTACVAARAGGVPELLEHEVSGWLVEPGNAETLAAGVERLLEDPPLRQRLAQAAQVRAREFFSADRTADRTAAFYQYLLSAKAADKCE